jgi:hypothetical protein
MIPPTLGGGKGYKPGQELAGYGGSAAPEDSWPDHNGAARHGKSCLTLHSLAKSTNCPHELTE